MKTLLVTIALLCLLASCRSSRAIGKAVGKKDSMERTAVAVDTPASDTLQFIKNTLAQVAQNRIDFTTFNAKLDVDYKGNDGKGRDVNANLRMYKDSAIWVSVNAILGLEAIRLLVTKDSVKLMNKLENTYAARGIGFLQEATGLPLDFTTLQDLIIGNPVYLDSNIVRYGRGGGTVTLVSLGSLFRNLLTFSESGTLLLQSKLTDVDPFRVRIADLSYSDYENKSGRSFATRRQMIVSERSRLEVKLNFKNYSFDEEVSFPFRVPDKFSRL